MLDINAEEVAEEIMSKMISNGTWESFRIKIASELNVNGDFKKMKTKVREMLNTNELKLLMRNTLTTEEMVATHIEKSNGFAQYKNAVEKLVDLNGKQNGTSIAVEFKETVDKMIDDYIHIMNINS